MVKKKRGCGVCAYCGQNAELTRDHVIPQSMFTTLPRYMITVPSCDACNNAKSRDDEYLRDMLVLDLHGSIHPIGREIAEGKAIRSVSRTQSALGRAIMEHGKPVDAFTPNGLRLPDYAVSVPVDVARIQRAIATVVRGLYFHERGGNRLPNDYTISVRRHSIMRGPEIWRELTEGGFSQPTQLGEGVFVGTFACLDDDPYVSIWGLLFYEAIMFTATTDAPIPRLKRPQLSRGITSKILPR